MNKIKLFLVAAAMAAAPAMAADDKTAFDWEMWAILNSGVEVCMDVGEGAVDVAGEVAGTVVVDIPVGLVEASGDAVAWVYQTSSGWYSSWYQADDCRGGYCGGFGR